ncbi:MAG: DnaJ domain-containing protein [Parvularculaceae bacterium]|nr:DnaJ domain-containing protein [Parvularculaceae bacterium]
MNLGLLALVLAFGAAGWLLFRMARGGAGADAGNMTLLKGVAFLVIAAALFAAKLWPLAFMTIVAAAAVTGIETWRDRIIREDRAREAAPVPQSEMKPGEAASVLGVPETAGAEEIKAAHRKLIGALHPDKGGTDYLAAKINDARDVLLRRIDGGGAAGEGGGSGTP